MAEEFFQKLRVVAANVQNEVSFITNSIQQPNGFIPSHVGPSKLKSMEAELRDLLINAESSYYDLKGNVEDISQHTKNLEETLKEFETNLNTIEVRLKKSGTYTPWHATQSTTPLKEPKELGLHTGIRGNSAFFTPIPANNTVCSPITAVGMPETDIFTPLNNGRMSSTPSELSVPKQSAKDGKDHIPVKKALRTPEEPLLSCRRFPYNPKFIARTINDGITGLQRKEIQESPLYLQRFTARDTENVTPEEPVVSRTIFVGDVSNKGEKKKTPEEPVLNASTKTSVNPSTPKMPVLKSSYFR